MLTLEVLRKMLGWCSLINISLLYVWFCLLIFAHDWMYALHPKWFNLSKERFDAIHYAGMAIFKMSIILLNLTPYLALLIIT